MCSPLGVGPGRAPPAGDGGEVMGMSPSDDASRG